MSSSRFVRSSIALVLLLVLGCVDANTRLRRKMESLQPSDRIEAIVEVTQQQTEDLIPAIVDRLDDSDSAVRLYAILGLERLTGQRLGYSYAVPASQRRKAVRAWRQFVSEQYGGQKPRLAQNGPTPESKAADNAEGTEGM